MMVQIQIHPLPDKATLFKKIVDAINAAAGQVLHDEGITTELTPVTVSSSDDPMAVQGSGNVH